MSTPMPLSNAAALGQRQPREPRRRCVPARATRSSGTAPGAPDWGDRRVAKAVAACVFAGTRKRSRAACPLSAQTRARPPRAQEYRGGSNAGKRRSLPSPAFPLRRAERAPTYEMGKLLLVVPRERHVGSYPGSRNA